ncbi:follistatin [Caerostris extrusa]|uniref:Follistatin n=1 Tax=Caerostris extrusa TaxID=172846 RepID=A0AAV4UBA8_CAEEX|nr:follistatin [Caerostris extrusa]
MSNVREELVVYPVSNCWFSISKIYRHELPLLQMTCTCDLVYLATGLQLDLTLDPRFFSITIWTISDMTVPRKLHEGAGASCENIRCRKDQRCLIDPKGGPPRCVTCPNQCQVPKTAMLCASNNYTYSTWCHMIQDACKHGILLEPKYEGPCEETTSQQTNIIPLNVFESQVHL